MPRLIAPPPTAAGGAPVGPGDRAGSDETETEADRPEADQAGSHEDDEVQRADP
jgi:hypothetical protein